MFAVLKTGGKQYKVAIGDILRVEKITADIGETIQFDDILMLGGESPVVGLPVVSGASVKAEVVDQIKAHKVINFVKRRRKHGSKRTKGHRQNLTLVRVTDILLHNVHKSEKDALSVEQTLDAKSAKKDDVNKSKSIGMAKNDIEDLTQLSGLGPTIFKKLTEAGVTSFAQIASWSAEDIAVFDEKLSLKGRIDREGWIDQAKAYVKKSL